ncbi:hypothetical protein KIPB_008021 [Kipferlia bialata]|uniref:Uncharacterized protein n=1 Tax=Kipferlia bialata TaxID=797122 RepID=A0A9K3D1B0_9EUKA|nr:hypothetical protein KIPB_008021 [Kipferlia bialata]|eukprot:g8021.t1
MSETPASLSGGEKPTGPEEIVGPTPGPAHTGNMPLLLPDKPIEFVAYPKAEGEQISHIEDGMRWLEQQTEWDILTGLMGEGEGEGEGEGVSGLRDAILLSADRYFPLTLAILTESGSETHQVLEEAMLGEIVTESLSLPSSETESLSHANLCPALASLLCMRQICILARENAPRLLVAGALAPLGALMMPGSNHRMEVRCLSARVASAMFNTSPQALNDILGLENMRETAVFAAASAMAMLQSLYPGITVPPADQTLSDLYHRCAASVSSLVYLSASGIGVADKLCSPVGAKVLSDIAVPLLWTASSVSRSFVVNGIIPAASSAINAFPDVYVVVEMAMRVLAASTDRIVMSHDAIAEDGTVIPTTEKPIMMVYKHAAAAVRAVCARMKAFFDMAANPSQGKVPRIAPVLLNGATVAVLCLLHAGGTCNQQDKLCKVAVESGIAPILARTVSGIQQQNKDEGMEGDEMRRLTVPGSMGHLLQMLMSHPFSRDAMVKQLAKVGININPTQRGMVTKK